MSATYLEAIKRQLEALTLDELEALQAHLVGVVVRRRHVVRGLDADELELRRDTDPAPTSVPIGAPLRASCPLDFDDLGDHDQ